MFYGFINELLVELEGKAGDEFAAIIHWRSLNVTQVFVQATAGVNHEVVSRAFIVSPEAVGNAGRRIDEQMRIVGWDPRGHKLFGPPGLVVFWPVLFHAFG
jgi:hypothetical protein